MPIFGFDLLYGYDHLCIPVYVQSTMVLINMIVINLAGGGQNVCGKGPYLNHLFPAIIFDQEQLLFHTYKSWYEWSAHSAKRVA